MRDVASSGIDDLQFSERKDEITLAVRERGCANAHIARHHALRVERHQRGGVRAAGVASCRRDQLHLRLKLGIVGRLDAKLFGETESSADSVEGVAAGREHDLIERARRTEIDLHPLLRVRIEGNLAVISVLGRVLLGRILLGRRAWHSSCEFRRCRGNLAIELHQRVAGGVGKCSIDRLQFIAQPRALRRKFVAFARDFGSRVITLVRAINRGEHRLQRVVVFLRNRIELVFVALRALHGDARKGADGVAHHVVAVEVARELSVDLLLADFLVPDEVPWSSRDEAKRFDAIARARKQRVACDLLLDEPRVRLVLVERADHIVAVRPRVLARLVFVVAVGVGVVDNIEPVARPSLTVARRREQSIDEALVLVAGGVGCGVGGVRVNLLRRRRQTDEVEIHAPTQRARIGLLRHR